MNYIILFIRKNLTGLVFVCLLFYILYSYVHVQFVLTLLLVYIIYFIFLLYMSLRLNTYTFSSKKSDIPNHIYSYWHDREQPECVKRCVESWKKHNPSYTIHMIHKDNLSDYMTYTPCYVPSQQFFSDILRLHVLSKRGGIWLDASVYLNAPLDWVHTAQKKHNCEFVGYEQYTGLSTPTVESWCFGCIPQSSFVNAWKDEFLKIQTTPIKKYISSLKKTVTLDHIYDPEYLSVYAAGHMVLHKKKYRLYLLDADGPMSTNAMIGYPFYPLFYKEPVVKFINWQRRMVHNFGLYHYL